jgi:hypothetical protein
MSLTGPFGLVVSSSACYTFKTNNSPSYINSWGTVAKYFRLSVNVTLITTKMRALGSKLRSRTRWPRITGRLDASHTPSPQQNTMFRLTDLFPFPGGNSGKGNLLGWIRWTSETQCSVFCSEHWTTQERSMQSSEHVTTDQNQLICLCTDSARKWRLEDGAQVENRGTSAAARLMCRSNGINVEKSYH